MNRASKERVMGVYECFADVAGAREYACIAALLSWGQTYPGACWRPPKIINATPARCSGALWKIGRAHEVAIALARGAAAFVEGPHDQALPAAAVARCEHARDAGGVLFVLR